MQVRSGSNYNNTTSPHTHNSNTADPVTSIASMSSETPNRRLRVMEALDQRLDELEEFQQYGDEYKSLLEETDLIEDENLLFELERHRRNLEQEPLAGTVWEPSFVLCWVIVSIVTMYVGFLIVAGDMDNKFYKEEL